MSKKVIVKLYGKALVFWMENITSEHIYSDIDLQSSFHKLEEDGIIDGNLLEQPFYVEAPLVSWWYEGEKSDYIFDINYIDTENYLSAILEVPFILQYKNYTMIEEIFEIEIPNEEEFDPTKLQLINSDNEVEQIPFGIVTNQIMYDGEIIKSQNQQCYANKEGFMVICDDYLRYL